MMYSHSRAFLFSFLLFLFSFVGPWSVVSANSSCNWCRRQSPDGIPGDGVCYGCNDTSRCSSDASITSTCSSFSFDSYTSRLEASCTNDNNVAAYTAFDLDSIVGNINGVLTLGQKDFSRSCFDIQFSTRTEDKLVMVADCHGGSGSIIQSELTISSVLANENGEIVPTGTLSKDMSTQPDSWSGLSVCVLGVSCGAGFVRSENPLGGCISCNSSSVVAHLGQYCDGYHFSPRSCPAGYYCLGGNQSKVICESGCYCDSGASKACDACPAGMWCNRGQKPVRCPEQYYCPAGITTGPILCDHDCVCSGAAIEACPEKCRDGYVCNSTYINRCPVRHYCQNNNVLPCPANTYGDETSLSDDTCSGKCGVLWSSPEGSDACLAYSPGGIMLITFIVVTCTAMFLFGSANMYKWKALYIVHGGVPAVVSNEIAENRVDGGLNPIAVQIRADKQMQIKTGVAGLVTKVNNQIFSSICNIPFLLMHHNLAQEHQVNDHTVLARQQFTDHLFTALLAHPRLHFDDQTLPYCLPSWAQRVEGSMSGEKELVAAAQILSRDLASAAEQDVLQYFRKQREYKAQRQQNQDRPSSEFIRPLQETSESDSASSLAWTWPAVDQQLAAALPLALPLPYNSDYIATLRVPYGHVSLLQAPTFGALWTSICYLLDLLIILAALISMSGLPLLTIHMNAADPNYAAGILNWAQDPINIEVSWQSHTSDLEKPFYYYTTGVQIGSSLFQPVLNECLEVFGPCYFTLLLLALLCYCTTFLSGTISACLSEFKPGSKCCWNSKRKWDVALRTLGLCALISAIVVYQAGCATRLNRLPTLMRIPYPLTNYWHPSTPLPDPITDWEFPMRKANASVKLQGPFILTIAAMVTAFITTFWAFQKLHPTRPTPKLLPPAAQPDKVSAAQATDPANVTGAGAAPVPQQSQSDPRVAPLPGSVIGLPVVQPGVGVPFPNYPLPLSYQHWPQQPVMDGIPANSPPVHFHLQLHPQYGYMHPHSIAEPIIAEGLTQPEGESSQHVLQQPREVELAAINASANVEAQQP